MTSSISVNPLLFPYIHLNLGIYTNPHEGTKYRLDIQEIILRQKQYFVVKSCDAFLFSFEYYDVLECWVEKDVRGSC
jgi:hypothetical protein